MKKFLLSVIISMAFVPMALAQCTQLFISEYVEGSNNNKALELYNPTANPINLNGYQLVRYSNGGTTPYAVTLSGVVPAYGTFVTVLDKRDTTLTGQDTSVFAELLALADTFLCPDYNVNRMHYFNGDDAVTLELTTGVYLDIIGKIGEDPGVAWTCDTAAGFTDALGGTWMTANKTLIRKPTIKGGVTVNPPYFNPCAEWDAQPTNTFTNLRWHECECDPGSGIADYQPGHHAFLYPNPVRGGNFIVKGTRIIDGVELFTTSGQMIASHKNPDKRGDMVVNLGQDSKPGILMIRIIFEDQGSVVKRVIVQ
ncbi:MAG: lamin tail domain-containing protein [Bacteroidales bacterium]